MRNNIKARIENNFQEYKLNIDNLKYYSGQYIKVTFDITFIKNNNFIKVRCIVSNSETYKKAIKRSIALN